MTDIEQRVREIVIEATSDAIDSLHRSLADAHARIAAVEQDDRYDARLDFVREDVKDLKRRLSALESPAPPPDEVERLREAVIEAAQRWRNPGDSSTYANLRALEVAVTALVAARSSSKEQRQ